eukprot:1804917-Prymnesium_polylepis.1
MESLRHLLSFIYNPKSGKYVPIKVWENEKHPSDFILAATIAGRHSREKKYAEIAKEMNTVAGPSGRCERNAVECTSLLYSKYSKALRPQYTFDRPAQL